MAKKPPPPPPPTPPKGKKTPPPPPPPPKKKAPPPPPPPKKKAPPPKPTKAPSTADIKKQIAAAVEAEDFELAAKLKKTLTKSTKAPPVKKAPPPPPPKKKAPPPAKKTPPPKPTKAPPTKKKPSAKKTTKKGRRIRIKLGLKQSRLREDDETTTPEDIGWTISQETLEAYDEPESTGPEIVSHQCSMCGSIMQIPSPKRDRYKVVCAYSECGHEDTFGI